VCSIIDTYPRLGILASDIPQKHEDFVVGGPLTAKEGEEEALAELEALCIRI
jgi:hypothetical protein